MNCECQNWADDGRDYPYMLLTGHHYRCQDRDNRVGMKNALEVIKDLVKAMETWGADCDGVHPQAWEIYKKAKIILGQFDWKEDK